MRRNLIPCCLGGLLVLSLSFGFAQEPVFSAPAKLAAGEWTAEQQQHQRLAMLEFLGRDTNLVGIAAVRTAVPDPEKLQQLESGSTIPGDGLLMLGVHFPIDESIAFDAPQVSALIPDAAPLAAGGILRSESRGEFRWTKAYESPGATGLRLHIQEMDLPAGVEMYVYGFHDEFEAHGPYTGRGVNDSGEMWTNTVFSDRIYLEVRAHTLSGSPDFASTRFRVEELAHLGGPYWESAETTSWRHRNSPPCRLDIACAHSEFGRIDVVKKAVARMSIPKDGYSGICTGTLIADDMEHLNEFFQPPYMLTANHCLSKNSQAYGMESFYQYYIEKCVEDPPTLASRPRTLGAGLLVTRSQNDMTLLLLSERPPEGSVYLGWTTQSFSDKQDNLFRLSHPLGLPMQLTREAYFTDPSIYYTCESKTEYHYTRPRVGLSTSGSSGSALITEDMKIAGQHRGVCYFPSWSNCDYSSYNNINGKFSRTLPHVAQWLVTPPPAHDHFQVRYVLTDTEGFHHATTKNASRELGEPAHAGNSTSPTVWYQWTAPSAGSVIFATCTATAFDTVLAAYTGSTLSTLVRVAENDNFCNDGSRIMFDVVPGGTYHIAVAGSGTASGYFRLQWAHNNTPTMIMVHEPVNNVRTIWSHMEFRGTFTPQSSGISSLEYRTNLGPWNTNVNWVGYTYEWYFTASGLNKGSNRIDVRARNNFWSYGPLETRYVVVRDTPTVTITSPPNNHVIPHLQTSIEISGTATAPESTVALVDWRIGDDPTRHPATGTSSWSFEAIDLKYGANEFFVRAQSAEGLYSYNQPLVIHRQVVTPPHDNFLSAVVLSGTEGAHSSWTSLGTRQSGEPNHAGSIHSPSVWYRWTAPVGGGVYVFDTCSHATFDTVLAVYTGSSLSNLSPVAENDDAGGACGTRSMVAFTAIGGTTYYIAVAGYRDQHGEYTLRFALISEPTVQVLNPIPSLLLVQPEVDFFLMSGTASSERPINRVEVQTGGEGDWEIVEGTTMWSHRADLRYGTNTFAFRTINDLEMVSPTVTRMIRRDPPPPLIVITSPENIDILIPNAQTTYPFEGSSHSPAALVAGLQWRINGGDWTSSMINMSQTAPWWMVVSDLVPGANVVEVRVQDLTLKYSVPSTRTIIRAQVPFVRIRVPSFNASVPHSQTTIAFEGSVDSSGASVQWRIGEGQWQAATLQGIFWSFNASPLAVGENLVQVRGLNNFGEPGNTGSRVVTRLTTQYLPGDVNQDGILNVADVTLLSKFLRGLAQLPDESLADVDQNGKIGKPDLDRLVELIVE